MPEPFKNLLNPALVRDSAALLARHSKRFNARQFEALALPGLEALEMKARAMQIAAALEASLPANFYDAAALIEASLAPPEAGQAMADLRGIDQGLRGWMLWPVGEYIARRGLPHPERALATLHALTQRFTAEFAIRPFIVEHPDVVWPTLQRWCQDESPHVRRLVSEGSRPRLPWGLQLKRLIQDPAPTLPLLRALQDDTSDYVRRSVANHLNDIAKDHPALVADWLASHLPGASQERVALLRHASRTLVKQGDTRVLEAWGLGAAFKGTASLTLDRKRVRVGDSFTLALALQSMSSRAQTLVLDYAVHHVKADGSTRAKIFKGWQLTLAKGEHRALTRRHSMREITTRRYHPGAHRVDVMANGQVVASATFVLAL